MARDLLDRLWRDHPGAPSAGERGPRARVTTDDAVDAAVAMADADGLASVTIRALAHRLGVAPMSIYTYVGSREELLVLMADAVLRTVEVGAGARAAGTDESSGWRDRVRAVAEANRALHLAHPWVVDVADQRVALGPGAIAKYDRELGALDDLDLGDVERDAALTFVLDFVAASARATSANSAGVQIDWASIGPRLAGYLGDDHRLAQRVGAAAGAEMGAAYSAEHAWRFGLERVLDGLATARSR